MGKLSEKLYKTTTERRESKSGEVIPSYVVGPPPPSSGDGVNRPIALERKGDQA